MAEERRPEEAELRNARRKRRLKKGARRALAALCALAVLAGVFALLSVYFKLDLQSAAQNMAASLKKGGGYPISTEHIDVTGLLPIDGGTAVCSASGVDVYNASGAQIGTFRGRYIRPVTTVGGGKLLTVDLGGSAVRVTNKVKELFTYTSDGDIQAGAIGAGGVFAFSESCENYLSRVRVYNSLCEEIYTWSTGECYITGLAVSASGKMLAAAGIDPGGGGLRSWVRLREFSSDEETAAIALDDQIVISMQWNRSGALQVVTDRAVYLYNRKGEAQGSWTLPAEPVAVENSADGLIYVATGDCRSAGGTTVTALDSRLTVLGQTSVTRKILSLSLSDGRLYLLCEGQLLLADKKLSEVSDRGVSDLFFICPAGTEYYGISAAGLIKAKL